MRPFITLEGEAMDALEFYKSIFPNFSIDSIKYHQEPYGINHAGKICY